MQLSARILFITAAALMSSADAADIRQVSARGCGPDGCGSIGCGEACMVNDCRPGRRASRKARRSGDYCDPSGRQRCTVRSSMRDFVLDWNGNCGPNGRLARWGCPVAQKIKWCCETKGYPDSGWAPPAHMPIRRTGGTYPHYSGGSWGASYGGGAPMVYHPTDTTQLGYSYANVPTWQPNPARIPPVPHPSMYHTRFCPRDSRCGACAIAPTPGCVVSPHVISGDFVPAGSCPDCEAGFARVQSPPQPAASNMAAAMRPRQPQGKAAHVNMRHARQSQRPSTNAVRSRNAVRTVSNTKPAPPKPAAVRPNVQQQQRSRATSRNRQRPNSRIRQRTHSSRRQQKKSDGWFGLPSLSDVRF